MRVLSRDGSIFNASLDKEKKEGSYVKMHYDYQRYSSMREEIEVRKNMVAEM